MEGYSMELPPGFRFHPTDEELISHYLSPKVLDNGFSAVAIGEVDLNECEPWDLPWRAKMGEKEWYFFCQRDRKYPTGLRTNRATAAGYWKATGKDREIFEARALVGMKKTLVFYEGRAPRGQKSNWVMHEYRLEGEHSPPSKNSKKEWVLCRIFQKSCGGNKTHISALARHSQLRPASLPPLTDSQSHVTCFSGDTEDVKRRGDSDVSFFLQGFGSFPYGEAGLMQDPSVLNTLLHDPDAKRESDNTVRMSFGHQNGPSSSAGPVDLDCLWNY